MAYATPYIKAFAALALALFVLSCTDPLGIEKNVRVTEENSLEFVTVFRSSRDAFYKDAVYAIVKSKDEEDKLHTIIQGDFDGGNGVPGKIDLGETDYERDMLIALAPGIEPSGSNEIRITDIYEKDDTIYVKSELFLPEAGTDDMGYPCHIVRLKKQSKPVVFLEPERVNYGSGIRDIKFYTITQNEMKFEVPVNALFSAHTDQELKQVKAQYPGLFKSKDGTNVNVFAGTDLNTATVAGIVFPAFTGLRKASIKSIKEFGGNIHIYPVEEIESLQEPEFSIGSHIVYFENTDLPIVFEPIERIESHREKGEIPFQRIWSERNSFFTGDTLQKVITSKLQEDSLFMYEGNKQLLESFPPVDYSRKMMVCVALPKEAGEMTFVRIEKVFRKQGTVYVQPVRYVDNQQGQQSKNYPCAAILIDKTSLPVKILSLIHKKI